MKARPEEGLDSSVRGDEGLARRGDRWPQQFSSQVESVSVWGRSKVKSEESSLKGRAVLRVLNVLWGEVGGPSRTPQEIGEGEKHFSLRPLPRL